MLVHSCNNSHFLRYHSSSMFVCVKYKRCISYSGLLQSVQHVSETEVPFMAFEFSPEINQTLINI